MFLFTKKKNDEEDSINNYADIFNNYLSKPPTFSEALEQIFSFLKVENTKTLIKEIMTRSRNIVDNNFDKIHKNFPGITKEESMIISSFTLESDLYFNVNKILRGDRKNIKNISKYLFLFLKSLRKLKKHYPKHLYKAIYSSCSRRHIHRG